MLCGDDDEWKSVITGRVVRIVSLLLLLITTFTHPIPTANYRNIAKVIISNDGNENRSGFVVVVDDDDGGGGDNELSVSVVVDDDIVVY